MLRVLQTRPWFGGRLLVSNAAKVFDEKGALVDEQALYDAAIVAALQAANSEVRVAVGGRGVGVSGCRIACWGVGVALMGRVGVMVGSCVAVGVAVTVGWNGLP